jgi:hypothetical protein
MGRNREYDAKSILEAAGVRFLGGVKDDELFQYVELPKGWEKKPTDDNRWTMLVDERERERARIFYKPLFYDRKANMTLVTRFDFRRDYGRESTENVSLVYVSDCGEVVHTTEPIQLPDNRSRYQVAEQSDKAAVAWLDANYPDWRNPGAYWD